MLKRIQCGGLLLAICALASCSEGNGDTGAEGGGGPGAGSTSAGSPGGGGPGGGNTGGAGPGGGGPGGAGAGGGLMCTGEVLETLPIDASGWIPRECTIFDVQGAWYCFDDGVTATSCEAGKTPYASGGMCLSGTTLGATPGTWGGGIGVSLNETGGPNSIKEAYDAASHDVVGFAIEITGDTGGNELRVGFTSSATPMGASPFVPVPGPGSYDIMIADALVPANWNVPNAGEAANPAAIYDIQVQIDGNGVAAPFDFCISSLTPVLSGEGGTGGGGGQMPPPYGDEVCGDFATITLPGTYLVHNNVWNGAVPDGAQCIRALWDGASDVAGFVVEPNFNVGSSQPGSYPAIIYGWHYEYSVPSPYVAQQIQSINSIPSEWGYSVPAAGQYNVSYDLWVHPQQDPPNPNGGLEIMIWTTTRDVVPIGGNQGYTVGFGGAEWEVWYGSAGAWNTVTYRRVTNTSSVDMDLLPFVEHAVGQGYAQDSWYLLGVEAGFEIWEGNQAMTSSYYQVSVE
jgi:Glycosyl hydrolase family 12